MSEQRRQASRDALMDRAVVVLLAAVAYVPLLLTQPGRVGADTKTYLYLDPSRLMSNATSMWDPGIGAGTVTHQNIGYLWPMGPWYWTFEQLGVADWVAQRLWLATVLFCAGLGVRWMLRTIGFAGGTAGILVAALAYELSPYLLDYSARISVILLPWAALPWLIGLTARAVRTGGWRHPALFALVAVTVGGINATALLMVAFGPALWLLHAWLVERETDLGGVVRTTARMGALTLLTSLWWIAGLWAQGRYGLPVIRYTESYKTVADASTAPEVLRGLGYWFFYGRDKLGPWIEPSVEYTNRSLLLVISFSLPILALGAAACTRWRHRAYFLALIALGGLVAVGAHPWDGSSPLGAAFKSFTRTDWGLSLRSTPRAVPQVVLGTAVLLGAGVGGMARRLPRLTLPVTALVCALLAANLPTMWSGQMVARNLQRPEHIPAYWLEATQALDAADHSTRVLELPGSEFASYRWGNTVDPITPGLMDRPYLARELFAYGSPTSMGLLIALDRRLQEDVLDPEALAPVARLLGVGDVVLRADLQYERFRTPRPRLLWDQLLRAPGLDAPTSYGDPVPNVAGPEHPMLDEIELALDPALPHPPPVAVFGVQDPLPIVRARPVEQPMVLAGGPEGIVSAAATGLLERDRSILYSATLEPHDLQQALDDGAWLVVSDTNRRQGRRWGTIRENVGRTERAGEQPTHFDPTDNRLDLFPDAGDEHRTVSVQRGPATIWASDYGNAVTFTPDDRPANALDGDPFTAWRVGALEDPSGEFLQIDLQEPVRTDHVTLLQPTFGIANRTIAEARLHFDDGSTLDVALDDTSLEEPGQRIEFEERELRSVRIEILRTDVGPQRRYDGLSGVGFAEVGISDVQIEELIAPPTALLDAIGTRSDAHRLSLVLTRARSNAAEPVRMDEELAMRRLLELPSSRTFDVRGTARLSTYANDKVLDHLLGLPLASDGGVDASSSLRLPGAVFARASAAADGDVTTWWSPPFQTTRTDHLEYFLAEPLELDHLDLVIVTDGRHAAPKRISIRVDGFPITTYDVTPEDLDPVHEPGATSTVRIDLPPTRGQQITISFDEIAKRRTTDWYTSGRVELPIAIAEVGIDGLHIPAPTGEFDSGCRDDLLTIDDRPVWLRVTGTVQDALARRGLQVSLCGASSDGVTIDSGSSVLRTGIGRDVGIDLDLLLLDDDDPRAPAAPTSTAQVHASWQRATAGTVTVRGATEPYWLVLGQSHSLGWHATVGGTDLGQPQVLDGFANGWRIDPAELGADIEIALRWKPQRVVDLALLLSAFGVLLCLLIAWRGRADPGLGARREEPWLQFVPVTASPLNRRIGLGFVVAVSLFAVLTAPWGSPVPLAVALVAALSIRRRWASLPAAVAAACLAGAGAAITVQQYQYRYFPDFQWPREFDSLHVLGVLCLLLLATQATRDALGIRSSRTPAGEGATTRHRIGASDGRVDGSR